MVSLFELTLSLLSRLITTNTLTAPTAAAPTDNAATSGRIAYTDGPVAPVPAENYERYVTFLATGTRTFACDDPGDPSSAYKLLSFEYDLYDAETSRLDEEERGLSLGKHVLMPHRDAAGGNSVFYTANDTFTYWVGKTTKLVPDPEATSPLNLPLEQELRTEASEPKPGAGGDKYDMGVAVYATRFGAVGGNLPEDAECTGERTVASVTYYSMWRQIL